MQSTQYETLLQKIDSLMNEVNLLRAEVATLKKPTRKHATKKWSKTIMTFQGEPEMPPFESYRNELRLPKTDPFEL